VTEDLQLPPPPGSRVPPERAQRRRREPITREAIVETALRLLDRDGLDDLSMRRVAEELGTGAASLYHHVGSKDGLLDLVLDRVIGELEVPDPDPDRWQEQLKEVARAQRAGILRHRDIVRVSLGRIPLGPNALEYSERVLAILRAGALPDGLALTGQHLLIATVNGFTLDETEPPEHGDWSEAGNAVGDYIRSLPADRFPNLTAVADEFSRDRDAAFELLLDIFVSGLAARGASSPPSRRSR
jgi:TetR/AcrR family transcriptional regulator, tetracycline repressor protein